MTLDYPDKDALLTRLYDVHERHVSGLSPACRAGCPACCTRNVVITTLEGVRVLEHIRRAGPADRMMAVRAALSKKRLVPSVTLNRMAEMCMQGQEPPGDEADPADWPCPLLLDGKCAVYPARPLMCRSMVSSIDCRASGEARMDAFTLTVNDAALQIVEHADRPGVSGNLSDVLAYLDDENVRESYMKGRLQERENLLENRPAPALVSPREHQGRLMALLGEVMGMLKE